MPHSLNEFQPGAELASADLEQTILDGRIKGRTLAQLADELGMTAPGVSYHEKKILRRLVEANDRTGAELKALYLERLEFALRGLEPAVAAGKPFAVEKWVMVIDRMIKLTLPDIAKTGGITINNNLTAPGTLSPAEQVLHLIKRIKSESNIIEGEFSSLESHEVDSE